MQNDSNRPPIVQHGQANPFHVADPSQSGPSHPGTPHNILRNAKAAQRQSGLAIASLIVGIISIPGALLVVCGFLFGLPAVIMGHLAVSQISGSNGRLMGKGMATTGFILGYAGMVLSVAWVAYAIAIGPSDSLAEPQQFAKAESQIATDNGGNAHGNSAEAVLLAGDFARTMEKLDESAFTQTDAKIKLSGGHYVTWCQLREDSIAFVVHVPEYRRFDDEAKEYLHEAAWAVAHELAAKALEPGDKIGVGLRGVFLYGSVKTGIVSSTGASDGLQSSSKDKENLYSFFEDENEVD